MKTRSEWAKMMLKEIYKHAQRDDCYNCRQVLRAMGLDPSKKFGEQDDPLKESETT